MLSVVQTNMGLVNVNGLTGINNIGFTLTLQVSIGSSKTEQSNDLVFVGGFEPRLVLFSITLCLYSLLPWTSFCAMPALHARQ